MIKTLSRALPSGEKPSVRKPTKNRRAATSHRIYVDWKVKKTSYTQIRHRIKKRTQPPILELKSPKLDYFKFFFQIDGVQQRTLSHSWNFIQCARSTRADAKEVYLSAFLCLFRTHFHFYRNPFIEGSFVQGDCHGTGRWFSTSNGGWLFDGVFNHGRPVHGEMIVSGFF